MKKNGLLIRVALSAVFLAGCAHQEADQISVSIGGDVAGIRVTHHAGGETRQWSAAGEEIDALREWASGLDCRRAEYEEGQSPGDAEGGEVYDFVLTEGDGPDFSYVINGADGCYLLMEGVWYAVSDPVSPPVGE